MATTNRRFSAVNLVSAIGAIVLVGSEMVAAAFATGWALSGLLKLGEPLTYGVEAALVIAALVGSAMFARQVLRADPPFVAE